MKRWVWNQGADLLKKWLFPQVLPSLLARPVGLSRSPLLRTRMIQITVACTDVARLRRVVMQSCGDCVSFMRVLPLDHARRMQLCLRLEVQAVNTLMDAVMQAMPQAEFNLRHVI